MDILGKLENLVNLVNLTKIQILEHVESKYLKYVESHSYNFFWWLINFNFFLFLKMNIFVLRFAQEWTWRFICLFWCCLMITLDTFQSQIVFQICFDFWIFSDSSTWIFLLWDFIFLSARILKFWMLQDLEWIRRFLCELSLMSLIVFPDDHICRI